LGQAEDIASKTDNCIGFTWEDIPENELKTDLELKTLQKDLKKLKKKIKVMETGKSKKNAKPMDSEIHAPEPEAEAESKQPQPEADLENPVDGEKQNVELEDQVEILKTKGQLTDAEKEQLAKLEKRIQLKELKFKLETDMLFGRSYDEKKQLARLVKQLENELAKLDKQPKELEEMLKERNSLEEKIKSTTKVLFIYGSKKLKESTVYDSKWQTYGACCLKWHASAGNLNARAN
jgi:hypothetical protein